MLSVCDFFFAVYITGAHLYIRMYQFGFFFLGTNQHKHGHVHGHLHIHHHDHAAASRYVRLRRRVAVMVLEVGIAIHSIIIGLTLGVQPDGDSFNTLLAALCFHQFFEVCIAFGCVYSLCVN